MIERFLFDLLEIALWRKAFQRDDRRPLSSVPALPGPAALRASFQIPPRGHYEVNATIFQKRKLEILGGCNFELIDSLGREQAQYIINYCEVLAASEAQEQARVRQIEAQAREREDRRRLHRNIVTIILFAFVLFAGVCAWAWFDQQAQRERVAREQRREIEASERKALAAPKPTPASQTFLTNVQYSQRAAVLKYPDLSVKDSALNRKFLTRLEAWKNQHDPRLNRSDWPEKLADECAR